ncbi:MAG: hypothetical protein R3C18_06315 [Planctomycetaceae bacterium]
MSHQSKPCTACGEQLRAGMLRCRQCGQAVSNVPQGSVAKQAVHSSASVSIVASAPSIVAKVKPGSRPAREELKPHVRPTSPPPKSAIPKRPVTYVPKPGVNPKRRVAATFIAAILFGCVLWYVATTFVLVGNGADSGVELTAERAAAIWTVENYGVVTVMLSSGEERKFVAREHLPDEPFVVTGIDLWYQSIDPHELDFLPDLQHLTYLDLSQTDLSDEHMRYLAKSTGLHTLYLRGDQISKQGFESLPEMPVLEHFSCSANRAFDDEALAVVTGKMPRLKVFLCTSSGVTAEGLPALYEMKHLRHFRVEKSEIPQDAFDALQERLPKCHIRI